MSSLLPVAVYGLEVPPGDILVPAQFEFPATVSLAPAASPETSDESGLQLLID